MHHPGHWWQGSTNLESIQILKKPGGSLKDSFLGEGYVFTSYIMDLSEPSFFLVPTMLCEVHVETPVYHFQNSPLWHNSDIHLMCSDSVL
jgi:hypothetical protein